MPKNPHNRDLDAVDRRLLCALQRNGRISNTNLAEEVGLSASACHSRVRALEADGFIDKYTALLNEKAIGRSQTVFVHISLSSQTSSALADFEQAVGRSAHIQQCHLMSGQEDYLLQVIVRDAVEFEELHNKFLPRLPHVSRVSSSFALRTVRRTTEQLLD